MNTIIEKIRAEVERLQQDRTTPHTGKWYEGYNTATKKMMSFLSDLEKEENPTTAEGFEEEIEDWIEYLRNSNGVGDWTMGDILSTARHFAQWQKDQMMKEAVEGVIAGTNQFCAVLSIAREDFNKGDKVRVIIVKED